MLYLSTLDIVIQASAGVTTECRLKVNFLMKAQSFFTGSTHNSACVVDGSCTKISN